MAHLTISNFSCIRSASVDLAPLTILIGPQASGKSIISKLIYFCCQQMLMPFRSYSIEAPSYEDLLSSIAKDFQNWFPPGAWGKERFQIIFEAGPFAVKLTRKTRRSGPSSEVKVEFSEYFSSLYQNIVQSYEKKRVQAEKTSRPPQFVMQWQMAEAAEQKLKRELKKEFVSWQLFIPAGRSFFTSIGKAVPAFEQSGMLDPVTLEFGRLFASLRDRRSHHFYLAERKRTGVRNAMRELFGGEIKYDRTTEYVVTADGRKIPFGFLSSGQQELLPLWQALELYGERRPSSLICIEEPEAHLFPTAQSTLAQFLASTVSPIKATNKMLITTHSPYILAKFNNLIKAGAIAATSRSAEERVVKIVPKEAWLRKDVAVAYAVHDWEVTSIIDEDGLVHAEYLDRVSNDIAAEFSALLEIESEILK